MSDRSSVSDDQARSYYDRESMRGGLSVREFDRDCAREQWTLTDENPSVGRILCSEQDSAVARYALEGLRNAVLACEYQLALPDERRLAKQIEETRHRLLES